MTGLALWRLLRPHLPLLGFLLLVGVQTWRVGHYRGQRDAARAENSAINDRTSAAAVRIKAATRSMAASAVLITKGKNDALAGLAADRDALLVELRARPTRAAATAAQGTANRAAASGCTGAQLYRDDAEFLVREAAAADTVRISLKACYAQYDDVRKSLEALGREPLLR